MEQTDGIWAGRLGDAHVECYGLLDDLKHNASTEAEIGNIVEASNHIDRAIDLLAAAYDGTFTEEKEVTS